MTTYIIKHHQQLPDAASKRLLFLWNLNFQAKMKSNLMSYFSTYSPAPFHLSNSTVTLDSIKWKKIMWLKKLEPKTALSTWKKILVQLFISEFVSSIVITSNCVQCSQQANCSIQYWASRLFKTLQMILYYNPPCMLKLIKKLNQVFRVICFNKHNRVLSWVRYKFSLSFFLWETWHLQSDLYDLISLVMITLT